MKLPCHRQFRFVLLLHRPLQLPSQHALYSDCLNFPPNAFFFEKAVERRTAVIECFVALPLPSLAESSFVFTLVPARQLQIIQRRLLRFLDKAMQQNHPPLRIDVEQYPGDAALGQMRPYFANAVTEGSAYRHPDRPSKFDCLDILTDEFAILGLQAFQPFPEQFSARFRAKENRRNSLTLRPLRWRQCGFGCWGIFPLRCHLSSVPHTVQSRRE